MDINIPSQIVIKTEAQWAADTVIPAAQTILVTSDATYTGTNVRKIKTPNGTDLWAALDYAPLGGATDLSITNRTATTLDIASSTGTDATIPEASITEAGLLSATDKVQINNITNKVDKITGKGLSTEDYTNVEKTKVSNLSGTNTGDQDLSTKENTSNKTGTVATFEASTTLFATLAGITTWLKNTFSTWIGTHATAIVNADTIIFGKSGVLGTRTFAQFKTTLASTFQELIFKNNIQVDNTGTIAEVKMLSYDVTGKFEANDLLELKIRLSQTALASKSIRIRVNSTDNLVGSTQMGISTFTGTSPMMVRNMWFRNSLADIRVVASTTSIGNDTTAAIGASTTISTITHDFTGTTWLIITSQLTNSADEQNIHAVSLTRTR